MQSKLDFEAAMSLLSESGGKDEFDFERWLRERFPTLYVLGGKEHSQRLQVLFSRPGLHPFMHRMTGGCGNMEPQYWTGLQNLMDALRGFSPDGSVQPRMAGVGMFGGTRMLFKKNPLIVRPGVTEVFPTIADECPEAMMLGVVARYSKMFYTEYGLVIGTEPGQDFFTIVHPTQKAIALLQENADEVAPWDAEYLRSCDMCGDQQEVGWQVLLSAYGGGGVTKKEIDHWCLLSERANDPEQWRVLLYQGSGGIAGKLATDGAWLKDHPNVHVSEGCSTDEIRRALLSLGAIRLPQAR